MKKKLFFLYFFIIPELLSESYNFNWYPKENSNNNIVEMPNKDKFSMFLPDGVWEDSLGNYGNMSCVISAFTTIEKDVDLNGYCIATDNKRDKFWVNLSRNSFEAAGVGKMTFIDGTSKYKNLKGVSCPYGVLWIDNEGRTRGQGSIIKVKCSDDEEISKRLR
mgnify:CR=1 FL=1|tara:strand:+ start:400 stop:888 length:489 start_codon:yes stop_codon:yes gene_type:complete